MKDIQIRHVVPPDYSAVIAVVNNWWGGRNMVDMLPKLFFTHFQETSFVAERDGNIVGFLIGFISQSFSNEAYIHFAGVHPEFRKSGLGSSLYNQFFDAIKSCNRNVVRCVTSPKNKGSVSFHLSMGFSMEHGQKGADGIFVVENYDGEGEDRVLFYKKLVHNTTVEKDAPPKSVAPRLSP